MPPVLTRTWFHTGVYLGRDHVSDFFAGLLDAHDRASTTASRRGAMTTQKPEARLLPDTVLPPA